MSHCVIHSKLLMSEKHALVASEAVGVKCRKLASRHVPFASAATLGRRRVIACMHFKRLIEHITVLVNAGCSVAQRNQVVQRLFLPALSVNGNCFMSPRRAYGACLQRAVDYD